MPSRTAELSFPILGERCLVGYFGTRHGSMHTTTQKGDSHRYCDD